MRTTTSWQAVGIVILAAGLVIFAACGGGSTGATQNNTKATDTVTASPVGTPVPTATKQAVSAGLAATQTAPGDPGARLNTDDLAARGSGPTATGAFRGTRLVIPAINVDAPFTVRTVGEDGKMPNPQGPTDVAWYDFSGWPGLGGSPGLGGNAVMAGHVDYINYGLAVFWDLRKLAPGDTVTVVLDDGSEVAYAVQWNKSTTAEDADWTNIVSATSQESLTLITCAGQFDQGTRQYDERIVVWATRV